MKGTTHFWGEPAGRWQSFHWCECGAPLYGESELCKACAATKRETERWAVEDDIRRVRHMIHVWYVGGAE
jgi:hypothetical protein